MSQQTHNGDMNRLSLLNLAPLNTIRGTLKFLSAHARELVFFFADSYWV